MDIEIDINPDEFLECYKHLLTSDADIHFLWGGRDSGKSYFIAQKLIVDCLRNDYFRCIMVKKTYESIKDSQFQTIKDLVNKWKLNDLFKFNTSPLEITCVNGNKFIARGCDKPEKLKSIANPSDVWYEEGDHLTEEDYDTISTGLRAESDVKITEWFSFNPEARGKSFTEHWIDKRYLSKAKYNGNEVFEIETIVDDDPVKVKYTSTHTTYDNNPYCSPKRKAKHELLGTANPAKWRVYSRGFRGAADIDKPFIYNFERSKHVGKVTREDKELRFSTDFNFNPFATIVCQMWFDKDGHHIRVLKEHALVNKGVIDKIELIKTSYTAKDMATCLWTGDATQRKRTVEQNIVNGKNLHAWEQIDRAFRLGKRLQVPNVNPNVSRSRDLCNFVFALHPDLVIDESCTILINEIMYTEADDAGGINKKNRSNDNQKADFLDCFRYALNTWCNDIMDNPKKYGIK